uniref:SCP domain-containing protein n=1 Tax=Heterorhabditis bacteriophora TaxID=37862 RepID=A0A1I7W8K1_HETBA
MVVINTLTCCRCMWQWEMGNHGVIDWENVLGCSSDSLPVFSDAACSAARDAALTALANYWQ